MRFKIAVACLGVMFLGSLAVVRAGGDDDDWKSPALVTRVIRGYQLAPVRLNLRGRNPYLVGLGSYIVNGQGACNDCHTNPPFAPGGDPYQGQPTHINATNYLAGGTPFGPFISKNITPDLATGRPAGLTREEFIRLLRTGYDEDEGRLLQVMPWPVYGQMLDRDLMAVYEYLSAIPHAEPGP